MKDPGSGLGSRVGCRWALNAFKLDPDVVQGFRVSDSGRRIRGLGPRYFLWLPSWIRFRSTKASSLSGSPDIALASALSTNVSLISLSEDDQKCHGDNRQKDEWKPIDSPERYKQTNHQRSCDHGDMFHNMFVYKSRHRRAQGTKNRIF